MYIGSMDSTDGRPHAIQVYRSISARRSLPIPDSCRLMHLIELASESNYKNVSSYSLSHLQSQSTSAGFRNKIVEDAIIHFAMEQVTISPPYMGLPQETELFTRQSSPAKTYMSRENEVVRKAFIDTSVLPNSQEIDFRQIKE